MNQTPTAAHNFQLPITDEHALREFVRLAWGVHIPDKQVCPDHSTPWRAFADAYFVKSSIAAWVASRGFGGKSFLLALLGLTEAATLKANVTVLGGSSEQSNRVHEYTQQFWNWQGAPRQLLKSDPSKRETRLQWGNTIRALMASQASVRGPHPSRLRIDECDELDIKLFDAALGQPMNSNGVVAQTVASSTHQYANGTMTEVLRRAADKGWPVHHWCYKETMQPHGWLPKSEVVQKQADVTAVMWNVEYELQEPSPESRAIQPESVSKMFQRDLGDFEGRNGEYIEIEPPMMVCVKCDFEMSVDDATLIKLKQCPECKAKLDGASYSTGADWARKLDWTAIITLRYDCNPMRLVAFERQGRKPWPLMVGRFNTRLERYSGNAAHDGTGIGDVVDGYLEYGADSVIMVGRARSDLLSEYIAAIERDEIVSPLIKFMEAEHRYASVDDVYGSGHLPDTIAAGSLAYRGARRFIGFG